VKPVGKIERGGGPSLVIVVEGLYFVRLEGPKAHIVLKCLRHSPVLEEKFVVKKNKDQPMNHAVHLKPNFN
jgi:hypothetical protein